LVSNKYHRDFNYYGALKRPGRIDRTLFQDISDCGDGYGGIQWMMLKAFGTLLLPRFVIEGCEYNGVDTLPNGYIMWGGVPIEVVEQAIVVANGEFLYVNQNGVALTTAVLATAQTGVIIYERNATGTGYDIRFRVADSIIVALGITVQDLTVNQNVDIDGDLDVDGTTNLDNVDIDGNVDIAGATTIHSPLNMTTQVINNVGNPVAVGDAVNLATLRGFMPVGSIIMYNGVGWTDNVTMVGWYECTLANAAHGVPNLIDKFIRASAASGAGGGADTITLIANQIPTHVSDGQSVTHNHIVTVANSTTNHTHSGTTAVGVGNHTHIISSSGAHTHTWPQSAGVGTTKPFGRGLYEGAFTTLSDGAHTHTTNNQSGTHTHTVTTGNQSVQHDHTNTVGNTSVDHTHTYTNVAQPVNNMPVYYRLRFVMRTV
jgi:hypothetical protein